MEEKRNTPEVGSEERLNDEWLKDFYCEVGREVSLARESQRETHNWVIAIAGGFLTAAWALSNTESFYPSEKTFVLVLLIIPLIFRFFVRSCLEYQIFNRWKSLRNALDFYYFTKEIHKELNQKAMDSLVEQIRLYYFQWKQPESNWTMIYTNLQLAYAWPFIVTLGLLIWGLFSQPFTTLIWVVFIITSFWMGYEFYNFNKYFSERYAKKKIFINSKNL